MKTLIHQNVDMQDKQSESSVCHQDDLEHVALSLIVLIFQQISQKKLKKFEKEYHTLREQQEQQEAPIERYEVQLTWAKL